MAQDTDQPPVLNRTETPPPREASGPESERSSLRVSRRRSKRERMWLILGAGLAVLVVAFFLWRYFTSYESTDDAQVDVHLYPVSARISGYVIKVNVDDNQYVERGTVLVEIDPKDYQVAVDKARADLANAEATAQSLNINVPITSVNTSSQLRFSASDVDNAGAGIIAAEKQLAAAHAQVDQAEANDVKIQDDLKRYKLLVDKQEVSEQIYDQALAAARASTATIAANRANEAAAQQAVQQARARLVQAEANHRAAETGPQQVASTRARALSAAADVQQKRAALEQAELNLGYTQIVAPVSGEVNKTVVVGLNVQPGQQMLTVVPLDEVWMTANFKETQLTHMRPGEPVEITIDAFPDQVLHGHVDSIQRGTGSVFSALPAENATGNYVKVVQRVPVKVEFDGDEWRKLPLAPGLSVTPIVTVR